MVTIFLVRADGVQLPLSEYDMLHRAQFLEKWLNTGPGKDWNQGSYQIIAYDAKRNGPITPSAHAWYVYLISHTDAPGAWGYHDVDGNGFPYARVFVDDIHSAGVDWVQVATHELAEMIVNRFVNSWVNANPDGSQVAWCEACDPVEQNIYNATFGTDTHPVSNWVKPSYFRINGQKPYDKMGVLTAPFTPAAGGRQYLATIADAKEIGDKSGADHYDYPTHVAIPHDGKPDGDAS